MRVVSFVPSWTETLIEAGVDVVGRTRFCIHPKDQIKTIPVVGGTKNIFLEKVLELKPDLVLFDREENNKEMAEVCEQAGLKIFATHVMDLKSCGNSLLQLADILANQKLNEWGHFYLQIEKCDFIKLKNCLIKGNIDLADTEKIQYVIWKKPFMVISKNTFIGSVLSLFSVNVPTFTKKYPEITEEELKKSFCLFSSEPYPFAKDFDELVSCGFRAALVDGEKLSWYGIRTLRFLKA